MQPETVMSHEEEISELIMYVTDMRRTFNRKLDDHLFIMQQQNERIEKQIRTIDEQREVIDELAWQIRDLRDSIRQVKETTSRCVCNYENHQPRSKRRETIRESVDARMRLEDVTEIEDDDDIYEPVEINRNPAAFSPPARPPSLNFEDFPSFRRLPSPSSDASGTSRDGTKRTTRYVAAQSLPTDNTALNEALEKLRLIDSKESDSVADGLDDEDVLFRTKAFKSFARNSQRGSSKVVCSLISNVDEAFLPENYDEFQSLGTSTTNTSRNAVSDVNVDYVHVSDNVSDQRVIIKS